MQRAMNQINGGTAQMSGLSQQNTHAATAAIGENADTVQRLQSRTGAHQHMPPAPVGFEVALSIGLQEGAGGSQFNPDGVSHAARAETVTGEQTALRRQGQHSRIVKQKAPVALHGWVCPHGCVHRWRGQNWALTSQQKTGQQSLAITLHPTGQ